MASTLPPLPRSGPPYYVLETNEGHDNPSALSSRRESNFYSPRSGTWKLPIIELPGIDGLINEILSENEMPAISPGSPYFKQSPHSSTGSRNSDGVVGEGSYHFEHSRLSNHSEGVWLRAQSDVLGCHSFRGNCWYIMPYICTRTPIKASERTHTHITFVISSYFYLSMYHNTIRPLADMILIIHLWVYRMVDQMYIS